MALPLPDWLSRIPADRRGQARVRFLLRLAALYASERGTLADLSVELGYNPHTLATTACSRSQISPAMAKNIERELGPHLMPRELLCPEIFARLEAPAMP